MMANLISPKELQDYLKGKNYNIVEQKNDRFVATYRDIVHLNIQPHEILYEVKIWATDDESDSEEEITHDPLGFMVDFLSTGLDSDEFFKKMSSAKPADIAWLLRSLSSRIASVGKSDFKKYIRRIIARMSLDFRSFPRPRLAKSDPSEFERHTISDLKSKLHSKGWRIHDLNPLEISVNIGDQYEATISVDTLTWEYEILVEDNDNDVDMREDGITDDPFKDIRAFMVKPIVNDMLVEARKRGDAVKAEQQEGVTVKPSRK